MRNLELYFKEIARVSDTHVKCEYGRSNPIIQFQQVEPTNIRGIHLFNKPTKCE